MSKLNLTDASLKVFTRTNLLAIFLIVVALLSRLVPHPTNFTALGAVALFSGYLFKNPVLRFALPLFVLMISDYFIGYHSLILFTYLPFLFAILIGTLLQGKLKLATWFLSSLGTSVLFFLISNFGVWFEGILYPRDFSGLLNCYMMALPFFENQLAADLIFSAAVFSLHAFINNRINEVQLTSQRPGSLSSESVKH